MRIKPPLQKAQLLKRYKRFLADIRLEDGGIITVHCPNTGSMRNCLVEGSDCWISDSNNPARKYQYTWEMATTPGGGRAGINTHRANALAREAIESGLVSELQGYTSLQSEVKYGQENSRIDFLLTKRQLSKKGQLRDERACYVEVKSVTLAESNRRGYFPDSVSDRASKHLRELINVVEQGDRAVLFFCVQHNKINTVSPADHIDSKYGSLLREALAKGVEVIAYKAKLTVREIVLVGPVPFELS